MYGVVTRYVLKPKRSLARSSSAPHVVRQASWLEYTPREERSMAPDQMHYGATDAAATTRDSAIIVVPHADTHRAELQLKRSRSELPASRFTMFSYQSPHTTAQDEYKGEGESLLGFISAVDSDNTLPVLLTMTCCLGSLLFGFHIGFSSPFEDDVIATTGISKSQADLMFSLISIGAIIGSLASGPIAARLGRKFAIILSALPYLIGSLTMISALYISPLAFLLLAAGRTTIGVGVGASSVLVPLYVAEIAPPSLRGSLGATNSFFMSAGLVVVNALGIPAVTHAGFWKWTLLASLVPMLVMSVITFAFGCETPRYLMSIDREEEAKDALRRLRGAEWNVEGELNELADYDEVGVGSVSQSKEMLRRWKEEYMKYFQNEETNEMLHSEDVSDNYSEAEDLYSGITVKSVEMPSPRSGDSLNSGVSPSLKSALANKCPNYSQRATSAGDGAGADVTELPEPPVPRDKKTVRVRLPDKDEAESPSFLSSSSSSMSPSPKLPQSRPMRKAPSKHQSSNDSHNEKPSTLARARSIARRAFPIHALSTSTRPSSMGEEVEDSEAEGVAAYFQRRNLVPLLLGVSLQFIQQWSGINAFMFHLKDLLQDNNGGSSENANVSVSVSSGEVEQSNAIVALYGAIVVNGLQLVMGGLALILMDRAGRRLWLLVSCAGMTLGAGLLSYCYYALMSNAYKIASVMLYVAAFAIGMGPMPWLICSEIFPSAIRSMAVSLATTVNWMSAFVVTASYPILEAMLGQAGVYVVYGVIIAGSAVYIALALPETRGKSLDEIEEMFDTSKTGEHR